MSKYQTKISLVSDEKEIQEIMEFSIVCKNTGVLYKYDLKKKKYAISHRKITEIISWAIYKLRNSMGHTTRTKIIEIIPNFFEFLRDIELTDPHLLDSIVLKQFSQWLKNKTSLGYANAASMYRCLSSLFRMMNNHPLITKDFIPAKNQFPKSENLKSVNQGYDQNELKSISRAAAKALRSSLYLEDQYKPVSIGKPPPLDDVAPMNPETGYFSRGLSEDHRTWWWENNCQCKTLNYQEIASIPGGQTFLKYLCAGRPYKKSLHEFYEKIGAYQGYSPRFLGLSSPVKYSTPWQKHEYIAWYWENILNCELLREKEIKARAPGLWAAVKEYYGGSVTALYKSFGVNRWIQADDLIPYYLMLLLRTGFNPSVIQRLTIDCLKLDPTDSSREMINWIKFRSNKAGQSIPVEKYNDDWPVMLIKRVIKITAPYREEGQMELWITNANRHRISKPLERCAFQRGLRTFSTKNELRHTDGSPLIIQAKLIRPTIAWNEYLRTEDMNYLQQLLGHTKLSTTADYLRRRNDPTFLLRRSIHQEALFEGISANVRNIASLSRNYKHTENILNHCRDPMKSPIHGEQSGRMCSAKSEVCLGCQNLVITLTDIKKYFCYINFSDHLLSVGDIESNEYAQQTSEKKYIWETYILPRYKREVVEKIRLDAERFPLPQWDIAHYESKFSSNRNELQ